MRKIKKLHCKYLHGYDIFYASRQPTFCKSYSFSIKVLLFTRGLKRDGAV